MILQYNPALLGEQVFSPASAQPGLAMALPLEDCVSSMYSYCYVEGML